MDNSLVHLLTGVPLYNDYNNTLSWGTQSDQYNYFYGKRNTNLSMSNCTYFRKDNYISVDAGFDDVVSINYVMYRNSETSSKWYYAFVTDTEYKADGTTYLYIETDVMQTYYFDWTIHPSYVQREHVSDDTFGAHTYPEGLEYGEYVSNTHGNTGWRKPDGTSADMITLMNSYKIIVAATAFPNYTTGNPPSAITEVNYINYDKNEAITTGWRYHWFDLTEEGVTQLRDRLKILDEDGKLPEAITAIYVVPSFMVDTNFGEGTMHFARTKRFFDNNEEKYYSLQLNQPGSLGGYVPKNKKLLCYPYSVLYGTNKQGQNLEYHWEDFISDGSQNINHNWPIFQLHFSINENCKIMLVPINYKVTPPTNLWDYSLSLPAHVQCGWANDPYLAWLAQNGAGMAINAIMAVAGTVATIASGGLAAPAVVSGLSAVANDLNQMYKASIAPPSSHGNSGGSTLQIEKNNFFDLKHMYIKPEYARIIDNFFEKFGYKVCTIKIPNIRTRPQWNYVKTVDVTITGAIHAKDLRKICNCFNSGITFWRNAANVGNYNLNNH